VAAGCTRAVAGCEIGSNAKPRDLFVYGIDSIQPVRDRPRRCRIARVQGSVANRRVPA